MVLLADINDLQYMLFLSGLGEYIPKPQPFQIFWELSVLLLWKRIALKSECNKENFHILILYLVNKIF